MYAIRSYYVADAAGEAEMAEIFDVAHELGLSQAQLSGLLDWRFERLAGAGGRLEAELARAREESARVLQREWGRDYERNLKGPRCDAGEPVLPPVHVDDFRRVPKILPFRVGHVITSYSIHYTKLYE